MNDHELERIYDTYATGLFHYLVTFTRNQEDSRDLLQEIFIKLARGVSYDDSKEKAFLYRMGHNMAIDWTRRRKTRWNAEEQLLNELADDHHPAADPDQKELAASLLQVLRSLPIEQRSVVQLKLWNGLTFEEISVAQGIPMNTAASRYRYAIDKLRALLRPIYEELQ